MNEKYFVIEWKILRIRTKIISQVIIYEEIVQKEFYFTPI